MFLNLPGIDREGGRFWLLREGIDTRRCNRKSGTGASQSDTRASAGYPDILPLYLRTERVRFQQEIVRENAVRIERIYAKSSASSADLMLVSLVSRLAMSKTPHLNTSCACEDTVTPCGTR